MDLNNTIINTKKIQNNLEFLGNSCLKINNYKNFFYNRNNYKTFKSDGKININKNDLSIFRYIKHLMHSKKKWRNYHFKKRYLLRKRYKKQYLRIKNYIQKNILIHDFENHFKINSLFFESCTQLSLNKNNNYYLNFFELLYLKFRFISNILKKN